MQAGCFISCIDTVKTIKQKLNGMCQVAYNACGMHYYYVGQVTSLSFTDDHDN